MRRSRRRLRVRAQLLRAAEHQSKMFLQCFECLTLHAYADGRCTARADDIAAIKCRGRVRRWPASFETYMC
jgi:hypothetical protein